MTLMKMNFANPEAVSNAILGQAARLGACHRTLRLLAIASTFRIFCGVLGVDWRTVMERLDRVEADMTNQIGIGYRAAKQLIENDFQ